MTETKAGNLLKSWTVPQFPVALEYSDQIMDEIRLYALSGLKQLSRSGVEVGGVLFGSRGDNVMRIVAWRPISCEHAKGAALLLSQDDRIALGKLLQAAKADPELEGLHAVGWFVSHTRSGVGMAESDLRIYNHFFPWSWQVTMVLSPSHDTTRAGFFFRELDGSIRTESSYSEFSIEALPGPAKPVCYPIISEHLVGERATAPTPRKPDPAKDAKTSWFRDRRLWIWAVPLLLAVIVGAMLIDRPSSPAGGASIGLHVIEAGGELRLEWDRNAPAIRDAARATLDIKDGESNAPPLQLALDSFRLREGNFNYTRKSGDLEVRMTVYPVNGAPIEEFARFVGSPASSAKAGDATQLRSERDELSAENERLREALRKEAIRNHELEDAVRILENRMQVEKFRKPASPPRPE